MEKAFKSLKPGDLNQKPGDFLLLLLYGKQQLAMGLYEVAKKKVVDSPRILQSDTELESFNGLLGGVHGTLQVVLNFSGEVEPGRQKGLQNQWNDYLETRKAKFDFDNRFRNWPLVRFLRLGSIPCLVFQSFLADAPTIFHVKSQEQIDRIKTFADHNEQTGRNRLAAKFAKEVKNVSSTGDTIEEVEDTIRKHNLDACIQYFNSPKAPYSLEYIGKDGHIGVADIYFHVFLDEMYFTSEYLEAIKFYGKLKSYLIGQHFQFNTALQEQLQESGGVENFPEAGKDDLETIMKAVGDYVRKHSEPKPEPIDSEQLSFEKINQLREEDNWEEALAHCKEHLLAYPKGKHVKEVKKIQIQIDEKLASFDYQIDKYGKCSWPVLEVDATYSELSGFFNSKKLVRRKTLREEGQRLVDSIWKELDALENLDSQYIKKERVSIEAIFVKKDNEVYSVAFECKRTEGASSSSLLSQIDKIMLDIMGKPLKKFIEYAESPSS